MGRTTRRKKNRRKVLRGGGPNEDLLEAAQSGNLDALKAALDAGADINAGKNNLGPSSLFIASSEGHLDIVKELLSRGAIINMLDMLSGRTALTVAITNNHLEVVRELLDRGANIEGRDMYGTTALMSAVGGNRIDIVKELLNRGANFNVAEKSTGDTVLYNASQQRFLDIVKELLNRGADVNLANKKGRSPLHVTDNLEIVKELLNRGADVNLADKNGSSPLHLTENLDIVKELLNRGANIEAVNKWGMTPLLVFAHDGIITIVKELLDRGANIEAANIHGNTSLISAAATGLFDIVKLLLEKGANINAKNLKNLTAYDLATSDEIRDLIRPPKPEVDEMWGGFTQDDFVMFEQIFGDTQAASDFSICPVCHSQAHRADGCMFMHHKCTSLNPPGLDKTLYEKYLTPGYSQIYWCTVCGRICNDHLHKNIGPIDGRVPGNSPQPNTNEQFFGNDCRGIGGGGLVEKLARFNAILKTAHEMQPDAGKITVREAKKRLVKAAWEAPLTMDKAALEAQLASKTFPTPLSLFPTTSAPVAAVAPEVPAPNIPYPDITNPDLLPIVYPTGDDATLLDEVPNAVQFRHKKADGVVNVHNEELIGLENLMINVLQNDRNKNFASAVFGECWNSGGGCTAKLYPDEIQDAINKSTLTPEVKGQYEVVLADYRVKFNRKFKVGGEKRGGGLELRATQMFPLATDALADCPLPKKSGKRLTRRKLRKPKRKTGKRKTRK